MSESMVERVCSRALAKYDNPKHENWWPSYEGRARAAIEAMREPTAGMFYAVRRECGADARSAWYAGIDAALEEGKQ